MINLTRQAELMKNHQGFEHNQQSLRIVDLLECKYPHFHGLNLSYEVREGIKKHRTIYDHPQSGDGFCSLEAQVVNCADEITYTAHDVDDAIRSNILTDSDLIKHVTLWREYSNEVLSTHSQLNDNQYGYLMNSMLITNQIRNVIETSKHAIEQSGIRSLADLQQAKAQSMIGFSASFQQKIDELRAYLYDNYYHHYDIYRSNKKGQMIIETLFNALVKDTRLIPKEYYLEHTADQKERIVCDYISGMTDSFALAEYQDLYT